MVLVVVSAGGLGGCLGGGGGGAGQKNLSNTQAGLTAAGQSGQLICLSAA